MPGYEPVVLKGQPIVLAGYCGKRGRKRDWDSIGGAVSSAEIVPGRAALQPEATFQHESRSWYAVQTRYRCERKVAAQLQEKTIETFLPLREEAHRWSDRNKQIHIPLFPGYAFVCVDESRSSRLGVLQTPGLIGFVTAQGQAVPIPSNQIESLKLRLAQKVPCSLHPFLKIGQRVRVCGGCLHGLEGILLQSGPRNLGISIASIQQAVVVRIEGYELEPV